MKKIFTILSIIMVLFSSQVYGEEVEYIEDDMELVYQANQALKAKKYNEAVGLLKRSLRVREELYGEEHDLTLENYDGLSIAYFNLKDYKNAIVYAEKSLKIKEKKFGIEHLSTALSYHNLGVFYLEQKKYIQAEKYLKKTIKVREKFLGQKHKVVLFSYDILREVYHRQSSMYQKQIKYKLSLNYANKALHIQQKKLPKDYAKITIFYSFISTIYKDMGEYNKALQYAKKDLEISEKILPKNSYDFMAIYNNISLIYQDIGEYDKALSYANKSLNIFKNILPKNYLSIGAVYNNISSIYRNIGEYDKALSYANKALEIFENKLSSNYFEVANVYTNMALIYKDMGIYNKALSYGNKALEMFEKKSSSNYFKVASMYINMAFIYQSKKMYNKALNYANKALKISQKVLRPNHPLFINIYNNTSTIFLEKKNYEKALEYNNKSLEIGKKIFDKKHPTIAVIYGNSAVIYLRMEKYSMALKYVKKCLEIQKKILSKNHPDIAISYDNMSAIYGDIGKYEIAYDYAKKSFNIFFKNRDNNFLILNSKEKEKYLKSKSNNFFDISLKYILFLQKKKDKAKTNKILIDIVNAQLNYKGSILDSENAIDTFYSTTKDKKLKKQIKEWKSKKRYLAKLSQTVPKKNQKAKREKRIKKLEKEIEDLSYIFSKKALKFKEEENLNTISIVDIQKNLKEDELYFDIFNLKNQYYTFVLDRERVKFKKYDGNNSKQIDTLIKFFRTDIKTILDINGTVPQAKLKNLNETTKEKLSKLYNLIITKDIKEQLKDKKQIIISTDGLLRLLPFEALYDKNSNQYFIEQKEIRYVPSGKELVRLYKYRQYETTDNNQSIIFANPKFDANITSENRSNNVDLRVSDLGTLYMQFGNLAGTKKEAKAVKRILGENSVTEFQELKATEDNFMKTHRPPILHIATHGFFINSPKIFNPMLKSGIALSGANISAKEGRSDGIITALKLSGLNLRGTDLVVLSACNTGVVDVNSTESVSSLSKAFIQAGAKDVVMSLWSVDDLATKNLMKFFYKEIQEDKNYSHALRRAKIRMIKEGDPIFHWAGFVVNGL